MTTGCCATAGERSASGLQFDDELDELAETADYPILACWVFESDTCHIRGIGAAGRWDAWLNSGYAARLHAWNIVNDELGGDLHEGGSLADHARANRLEAEIAARLETERPDAARAVAAWATQSGQHSDVTRIEAILATPWKPQAQRGFFTLLAQLGIAEEEPGPER